MPSEKRARQRAYRDQKRAIEEQRRRRRRALRRLGYGGGVVVVVLGLIVLFVELGSSNPPKKAASKTTTTTTVPKPPTTAPVSKVAVAPVCPPATPQGAAKRVIAFTKAPPVCIAPNAVFDVTFVTDAGTFVAKMPAAASPAAVNNFVFLARYHFFDGIVFQRVVPGFVIQGGDPTGTGTGGPGYSWTGNTPPKSCEATSSCYPVWSIAMANSNGPSTNASQFFVVLPGGQKVLDQEPNYTEFGQVISGTSVVAKIGAGGTAGGTPKDLYYMKSVTVAQVSGSAAPSSAAAAAAPSATAAAAATTTIGATASTAGTTATATTKPAAATATTATTKP